MLTQITFIRLLTHVVPSSNRKARLSNTRSNENDPLLFQRASPQPPYTNNMLHSRLRTDTTLYLFKLRSPIIIIPPALMAFVMTKAFILLLHLIDSWMAFISYNAIMIKEKQKSVIWMSLSFIGKYTDLLWTHQCSYIKKKGLGSFYHPPTEISDKRLYKME